jgi:hypothetical protein
MDSLLETVVEKTEEYLSVPSVVGSEGPFLRHLEADFQGLGWQTLARANVVQARPAGDGAGPLISIHIDRHGLLANGEGELEYAAFALRALKYHESPGSTRRMLEKVCHRFLGETLCAYDPATGRTLSEGRVDESYVCPIRDNLIFRVPELEDLDAGTPVSYELRGWQEGDEVVGQLDNAVSAAVAYGLARAGFQGTLVFTTEEEIGHSWRHLQDHLEHIGWNGGPILVLDTSPFQPEDQIAMDGVVLRHRDANGVFDAQTVLSLQKLARHQGISTLMKDEWLQARARNGATSSLGSTELGRLVAATDGRFTGATVQLPTLGYHTHRERTSRQALRAYLDLLLAYGEVA